MYLGIASLPRLWTRAACDVCACLWCCLIHRSQLYMVFYIHHCICFGLLTRLTRKTGSVKKHKSVKQCVRCVFLFAFLISFDVLVFDAAPPAATAAAHSPRRLSHISQPQSWPRLGTCWPSQLMQLHRNCAGRARLAGPRLIIDMFRRDRQVWTVVNTAMHGCEGARPWFYFPRSASASWACRAYSCTLDRMTR